MWCRGHSRISYLDLLETGIVGSAVLYAVLLGYGIYSHRGWYSTIVQGGRDGNGFSILG